VVEGDAGGSNGGDDGGGHKTRLTDKYFPYNAQKR